MSELPRRRRVPEERPRQILEAALAVFGEQGLAGARIDDIAERAGISKGTVYLYFASKDDLFREVLRDTFAEMLEIASAVEDTASAKADLKTFCRNYWTFLRSSRFETVYRLVMSEIHAFPELSRDYSVEVKDPIKQILTRILNHGVKTGEFSKGNNTVRARMLLALLWQNGIWCSRREFNPDLEGRTDAAVLNEVMSFYLEAVATSDEK